MHVHGEVVERKNICTENELLDVGNSEKPQGGATLAKVDGERPQALGVCR